MRRSFRCILLAALAVACILVRRPGSAWAGTFEVSPVRMQLSSASKSSLFTVKNTSSEEVRFQVSAFAWTQTAQGEMRLSPTQDLVFFPAMLTVPAGESRKIRVGSAVPFDAVEKTYRIFVEEMPPLARGTGPGAVRVLTRMGMPVFLVPDSAKPAPAVRGVVLQGHTLAFSVDDRGSAHFMARSIRVVGKDAGGHTVFEKTIPGWYILPGGTRDYTVDVPAGVCTSLASVSVFVDTDEATVRAELSRAPAECG